MVRIAALLLILVNSAFAADLGSDAQRAAGQGLYEKHCVQCHGEKGDGVGPSSQFYRPAPRDFTKGKYKVRSTASGELPLDSDIKNAIAKGLAFHSGGAFTVMPPWPKFSDEQLMNLVYYLKSFASDFKDPEYNNPKAIEIPQAIASSAESIKRGREVFEVNECIKCHGAVGRSDGRSAPTLKDDWDYPIRPADLSKKWTFRGGSTNEDIFRTISTGFNGTPMPAYSDSTSVEDRWHLVNYIASLSNRETASYSKSDRPVVVTPISGEIDLSDLEKARALFGSAPAANIALVGQVIEPGRAFFPGTNEIAVSAIYNEKEVAVMLKWNDLRADTSGTNGPDIDVPRFEPKAPEIAKKDEDDDPFGEEEDEEDPFGEDDPFAEDGDDLENTATGSQYSDAVAIQIPSKLSGSFEKPYFIFGDGKNSVELWFADLAKKEGSVYLGKGSSNIKPDPSRKVSTVSNYDNGRWTVIFKRSLDAESGTSFVEKTFIPVAFSVWDGFSEERGSKRGLTPWYSFYVEPMKKESPVAPMLMYGLGLIALEIMLIVFLRRKAKQ